MDEANAVLRALLDEAGLSHAGLARAVVAAGAAEGVHLGTNPTAVARMLAGAQPRWPVPRLVAKVLSHRLHREVAVHECGFADRSPPVDDRYDGLRCSGTAEGTVRTIIELAGRDMNRRSFLLGTTFTAAAFTEPALLALTVPPVGSAARAAGPRVGMADVEVITENLAYLRRLDYRYGSGRVREQVVQLLHRQATAVLHGSYSESTGRALLGAVAQVSQLAGSMAADVGRSALAQRYYIQALNLAMSAGNGPFAADVLARMAQLTIRIAHAATDHDRTRQARCAVALTETAHRVAREAGTPMQSALLRVVQARAYALLGDASASRRAIAQAERHHEQVRREDEPAWLAFFDEPQLTNGIGLCLRDLGDTGPAIRLIARSLDAHEPWRLRSRGIIATDLAMAHLAAGDHEAAAAAGRDAVRTAAQVSSTRSRDRLRVLQRQLRPLRATSTHLRELDARITCLTAVT